MYQVGDRVVHPSTRGGIIEVSCRNGWADSWAATTCSECLRRADAEDPHRQLRGHRRPALSTSGRIREVLSAIPGLEIDRTTNWNRRYRENLNRLKSGDLLEVARYLKEKHPNLPLRINTNGLSDLIWQKPPPPC